MDSASSESGAMQRKESHQMGVLSCASYVVGSIIGTGIFITPNSVLKATGSIGLDLVIWLLCGLTSLIGGLVYIELATGIPDPGADFAYTVFVGWEALAFGFMWVSTLVSYPASAAVQAQTFGEYLVKGFTQLTDFQQDASIRALALVLILFLTVINFFSIRDVVGRFQMVITGAKVIVIIIVVTFGIYRAIANPGIAHTNFKDPFAQSKWELPALGSAFYMGLFAYSGWEVLNYGTPEIRNPARTMPFSLIGGISFVTLVYLLMNTAYFLVLPQSTVMNSTVVAIDFAESAFGAFYYFLPLMVAVTVVGALNSTIFCSSRFMQAAARRGHLPAFLSALNETSNSPRAALTAQFVLAAVFCFVPTDDLIHYVSFVIWGQKFVTLSALIYIRYRRIPVADGVIRVPLPLIILFWFISLALFISPFSRDWKMAGITFAIIAGGIVVYFLLVRRNRLPTVIENMNNSLGKFVCHVFNCRLDQSEPKCTELIVKPANVFVEPMHPVISEDSLPKSSEITEVDVVFEKK